MSNWITVADENEIPPGRWKVVEIDDTEIMIINKDGEYYAIEDICTHDGGPLSDGELEGDEIICPRHGAHFCIRTGRATVPPAYEDIAAFRVRVHEGKVQVCEEE
ncbi:MAG: ferredoxin [Legionellales bacterium]|nr:ferredoxin [Legionellales bacterium]|tara:strand:+ start:32974 stop:33288 length:315 start_codon:yes stop_codon:yes gene_type:complete